MSTYADKLKDPRWQRKRLEIFQRDNFQCVNGCSELLEIHVHHLCYKPGKNPWEYDESLLRTLCVNCHKKAHPSPINESVKGQFFRWEFECNILWYNCTCITWGDWYVSDSCGEHFCGICGLARGREEALLKFPIFKFWNEKTYEWDLPL